MKIKDLIQRIIEGDPKVENKIYVNINTQVAKDNFDLFESILYRHIDSKNLTLSLISENNDIGGILYKYQNIHLSTHVKMMRDLWNNQLDLEENKQTKIMELISKK